jgi:transposase InsO family protein
MQIHSNATTNKKQRERLQQNTTKSNPKTCRALAKEMAVSLGTVHRWKHRTDTNDRSCRPNAIRYAFDPGEQALLLRLRQSGLSLDTLMDTVEPLLPHATRSSVYRLLKRQGISRRTVPQSQAETGQSQPGQAETSLYKKYGQFKDYDPQFKDYDPGFIHLDCFYLPKLEGQKRYCFVAIDRATRLCFLAVYERKDKKAATAFLRQCLAFFPFRLQKILTDNGREFTLKTFRNRWGSQTKSVHDFDVLCQEAGIEHRTTRPYTPKTNGMVERMNGLTKEATTNLHRYESAPQMLADLAGWLVVYNFYRKHRRIGKRTPYEAVLSWYEKAPTLFIKEPTALLVYRNRRS